MVTAWDASNRYMLNALQEMRLYSKQQPPFGWAGGMIEVSLQYETRKRRAWFQL